MNSIELAKKDPLSFADDRFIDFALREMETTLDVVERVLDICLDEEREKYPKFRMSWRCLPRLRVAALVSAWRFGILLQHIDWDNVSSMDVASLFGSVM